MKVLCLVGLTAVFGSASAISTPATSFGNSLTGGFTSKCKSHKIVQEDLDIFLVSDCEDLKRERHTPKLNLNTCLKNDQGTVAPFPSGHFGRSCYYPRLEEGSTIAVECECPSGVWCPTSKFNLDDVVGSVEGKLCCYGTCSD